MSQTSPDSFKLAIAALNENRLNDAEAAVQTVLADDRYDAQAQQLAGIIAMLRDRPDDAVRRFSRAVQCDPQLARAHSNLGLAKLEVGFGDEALLHCRRAVEIAPTDPELVFNLGVVQEAGGRLREAEQAYRRVLDLDDDHAKALLNLGSVLHRLGDSAAAESLFRKGQLRFSTDDAFASNLGHVLLDVDKPAEAESAFRSVVRRLASDTDAVAGLAAALRRQGKLDEAISLCAAATGGDVNPDVCRQLGMALLEQGKLGAAVEAFEKGLAVKRSPGGHAAITSDQTESSAGKLRHDIEQLEWLEARGLLEERFVGAADACRKVGQGLPENVPLASVFNLPFAARRRIGGFYNRLLRRGTQAALPGGAINPELAPAEIERDYRQNAPGMTIVDNFLRPAALTGLRRFCHESTFWFDFHHANGYLGAYLEEGFHCPLLLQVAEDLRELMPHVIGDLPLRQMWAYKYDSRLEGIEMHADFAAVNVNFWITADDANLDPQSGGMLIWDKAAPDDWDFGQYNSSDANDQARISDYLASCGADQKKVVYRENRAVIFNSDLFHKTDRIHFAPGYENRRINITMLFGARSQT